MADRPLSSQSDVLREVVELRRLVKTLQRHAEARSAKVRRALEAAETELQDWLDESRGDPKVFAPYDMRSTYRALRMVQGALKEVPEDA